MIITSEHAEKNAVLMTAQAMCAAARTAPKTRGIDHVVTAILTDEDLLVLAGAMDQTFQETGKTSFERDAKNVRASEAVVLIGTTEAKRGIGKICGLCHFEDCVACETADAVCVYDPMDLGIAIGSAVSVCADHRIDSRVMFSVGQVAKNMGVFSDDVTMVIGIPLSATRKSLYFDRK